VRERAGSRDYKAVKAAIEKMPLLKSLVTSLLKPEVLQTGEFYDRLARDIMEAEEEVVIYSPFTYKDRVEEILAFIKRSSAGFIVYTKPADEFRDTPRYWQEVNIGLLEGAGIDVVPRPKMHEKAILVDDGIAYFGSLNTLSRLNEEEGGDYMLRYAGPLVSSLIEDFLSSLRIDS